MMNDNEIIKALECCSSVDKFCSDCPLWGCERCIKKLTLYSFVLINRQKAEIERLTTLAELGNMRSNDYRAMRDKLKVANAEIERLRSMNQAKLDMIHDLRTDLETTKAEAFKEFAERLKRKGSSYFTHPNRVADLVTAVRIYDIDTLVKEMGVDDAE